MHLFFQVTNIILRSQMFNVLCPQEREREEEFNLNYVIFSIHSSPFMLLLLLRVLRRRIVFF